MSDFKNKLQDEQGRVFREAWIAGATRHYPGESKVSYIVPWEETPDWERESAAAIYGQVRAFIEATDGGTARLTCSQKGRFVALCWIGQILKCFPDPKPAYVADWDDMPQWQQETDADIFEAPGPEKVKVARHDHHCQRYPRFRRRPAHQAGRSAA